MPDAKAMDAQLVDAYKRLDEFSQDWIDEHVDALILEIRDKHGVKFNRANALELLAKLGTWMNENNL
jgi:hypothetical protein